MPRGTFQCPHPCGEPLLTHVSTGGVFFFGGFQCPPVNGCSNLLIANLVFLQEEMSKHPSILPFLNWKPQLSFNHKIHSLN